MYTGKSEFLKEVNREVLDTSLDLRNVQGGVFSYEGEFEGIRILVETSMNSVDCMTYFKNETVDELLESDTVRVYFNEVCALWVY